MSVTLVSGEPYLAVRIRNVPDVLAKEAGALGTLAYKAAPQTLTNEVYNKVRDRLSDALQKEGVAADVGIYTLPGGKPGATSDLGRGILVGAALVVASLFVYKAVSK